MLHVTSVKYLQDYKLLLTFDDNSSGVADLSNYLEGEIFEPLKDKKQFSQVKFDPMLATAVWPNGADLAPEFLKELLTKNES